MNVKKKGVALNAFETTASVVSAIAAQESARKIYVLDTNVLLHDPTSLFRFQEHLVVIPLHGLDEVDKKKGDPIIGFNARDVSQKLEQILSGGDPYQADRGIRIRNGYDGLLFFLAEYAEGSFPRDLDLSYYDNYLLASLIHLKQQVGRPVTLVTKDRNLGSSATFSGCRPRITSTTMSPRRASPASAIPCAPWCSRRPRSTRCSPPRSRTSGSWPTSTGSAALQRGRDPAGQAGNYLGLGYRSGDTLLFTQYDRVRVLGVGPKVLDRKNYSHNFEQAVCMTQAMNDEVQIQVVVGKAGTGKTHIAMAAALELVFLRKKYESIKLIKPIITKSRLGEDIGFLPGTVKRKLLPRMRPFVEKLQKLVGENGLEKEPGYQKLLDDGVIEMMNLADVRGADLSGSVVLFDEAQNANPFQMRTLGTRLGEDSKLIVMGDPTQIDNVYLDKYSNALVNVYQQARRFPEPFIATISLMQMVRSHTSRWFEEKIVPNVKKLSDKMTPAVGWRLPAEFD